MAVAIDATGTKTLSSAGVASLNYTGLTVGASLSNGAMLAMLSFDANVSAITCTWDSGGTNQAMTRIGTGTTNAGGFRAELFGLVAPTSGNKTLAVSWTTAAQLDIAAISVTGADQTGGTTTFAHVNTNTPATGSPTTISLVVTSAVGNMVGVAYVTNGTISSWAAPATSIYVDISPANMSAGAARQVGAASTTVTGNIGGATVSHTIIGVDIVAAVAAADTLFGQACL